jgi:ribose transport system permease protein
MSLASGPVAPGRMPDSDQSNPVPARRLAIAPQQVGLALALVVTIALFAFTTPYFFALDNGFNILRVASYTGIAAAIATLVLVGGGIDLSVAAVMALSGTVSAGLIEAGWPVWVAILAALGTAFVAGLINAFIVTTIGINPLIATIATQFIFRGFAYIVISQREILISDHHFLYFGQGDVLGVPTPALLMLLCFIGIGFAMKMTAFGQQVYAIGGSPDGQMAKLAGVPLKRRQYQIYIASAVLSGFAGLLLASYSGSGDGNSALGLELPIIAAAILGGTALGGGRGSVVGTLLGVLLLGVITNGMTLHNVTYVWGLVVQGVALLLAVVIDERRQRKERT